MSMRTDSLICSFVFHDDGPEEDLMVVGIKEKGQVPEPIHAVKGKEVLKIYHKLRGDDKHDRAD